MPGERFDLLTLQEAMDILGVSRATIDRWRKDKQLPYIKIGKEIWVDQAKLQAWVHLHDHEKPSAPRPESSGDARVVRIGYQSGAALLWSTLVIRRLGLLEEELRLTAPSRSYRVGWVDAPNGMELMEDLIGGRVHIASIGDYPMIAGMALGRVLPRFKPTFLAFDGKTSGGDGISLVVPARSAAAGPEELAGAKIATVGHSSASYRLQEWLKTHGVESEPVEHRAMIDCYYGIVGGEAGASVMWEPYLSWVRAIGAGVPILSEGIGGDYLTGLMAEESWAAANEDVVIAYLKAHLRAHAFIRREPGRAAAIVAEESGFPIAVVAGVLGQIRWDASLYDRDVRTLNRLVLGRPNGLPEADGSAAIGFGKPYLSEAVEALKLPGLPESPLSGEWSEDMVY